eukprot:766248-Pleurochrysis_carterae.AAC.6
MALVEETVSARPCEGSLTPALSPTGGAAAESTAGGGKTVPLAGELAACLLPGATPSSTITVGVWLQTRCNRHD